MTKVKKSSILLTCLLLALLCGLLFYIDGNASKYIIRITRLCAINIVLALSMNLVNGFTGIFSLGHAGFMAIGAYTVALLTIPVAKKETIFMLEPLIAPLNTLTLPFGAALIIGGLLAAALAFLIGLPCLRLRGDYLAIATLGFSEIIRIVITNAQSLTNGAQGLKSIRGDDVAADSVGFSLLRNTLLSFMLSAFLAAVGGGLFASYIGTIGPDVFQVSRTYDILMIVVMGGMGSISGSVLAAFIVTIGQEWLRVLDGPLPFLPFWPENGVSGMRMVVFSVLLLIIILFFRNGLFGHNEVTWSSIGRRLKTLGGHGREVSGHE